MTLLPESSASPPPMAFRHQERATHECERHHAVVGVDLRGRTAGWNDVELGFHKLVVISGRGGTAVTKKAIRVNRNAASKPGTDGKLTKAEGASGAIDLHYKILIGTGG